MKAKEIKTQIAQTFEKIIRTYLATSPDDNECSDIEDGTGLIVFNSSLLLNDEKIYGLFVKTDTINVKVDFSENENDDYLSTFELADYNGARLVELCVGVIQHMSNSEIAKIAQTFDVYRHAVRYVTKLNSVNFNFDTLYDLLTD